MKAILRSPRTLALLTAFGGSGLGLHGATSLHLGPSGGSSGETLAVPLEIRSVDSVTALQFDILYDASEVDISDVVAGVSAAGHILDFETIAEGVTRVVVVSNTNQIMTDGEVAQIQIALSADVPIDTAAVTFSNILFTDAEGTDVAVVWEPYVAMTSPLAGTRISPSKSLGLTAVAVDYVGEITSVEFFAGGESISVDSTAPYTATWTASGSGEVVLTAVAISSTTGTTTSLGLPVSIAPPPFPDWVGVNFTASERANPLISGLTADPEGDFINNLMEYALGLDPKVKDLEGLPQLEIVYVGPDGFAGLRYRANPDADDVIFEVEVSDDGTTWLSGEGVTELVSSAMVEGKREVLIRDLEPLITGDARTRLIRLNVTLDDE